MKDQWVNRNGVWHKYYDQSPDGKIESTACGKDLIKNIKIATSKPNPKKELICAICNKE